MLSSINSVWDHVRAATSFVISWQTGTLPLQAHNLAGEKCGASLLNGNYLSPNALYELLVFSTVLYFVKYELI